ncbi:hypothetical protein ACX1C1_21950 [Paenibacillus sp. strain BS8-2]
MVGMKLKMVCVLLIAALTAGCGANSLATNSGVPPTLTPAPCNAIIEWVDFLMVNDIKYYNIDDGSIEEPPITMEQLGEQVGEITYRLQDHACTDYTEKNGDAAFLPIGMAVYALKGYKPEFRVVARNKIYQVRHNPKAATIGELLDIEGKVAKVSLESSEDGSTIGDFSPEAAEAFVQELLPLERVGYEEVYEESKHESGIFLRVHLQDGTSFRMVYYEKANAFLAGAFGTDQLHTIIMTQRQQIKAAAGL